MEERLKSAYELAMERLKAKEGGGDEAQLSAGQRERISALRAEFRTRRDELLFLHKTATAKALEAQDEGRLRNLEADHEREMAKLADEEEKAVRAVRGA